MRERVSARPTIELRIRAGKASNFIKHFGTNAWLGIRVVLCCRVSTQSQRNHLPDQVAYLTRIVEAAGGTVVDIVCYEGWGGNPNWLVDAARKAQACGAILLAETTDRFIRSDDYHQSKRPNSQATEDDLELLRMCVGDVTLMTDLPPDETPGNVRSLQSSRGKNAKGNNGGRPKKRKKRIQKRWSIETKAQARQLHAKGFSLRRIAAKLNATVSTVQYWLAARDE